MKLCEIGISKPQQNSERLDDYHQRLQDLKMKDIGTGANATVYQHPKNDTIVVKVSVDGFAPENLPLKYLQYALKHQNNPHVPKIYGVRRYKPPGRARYDSYFIAFIEKLTEYGNVSRAKQRAILKKYIGPLFTEKGSAGYAFETLANKQTIDLLRKQHRKIGVPSKDFLDVMTFISQQNNDHLDLSDWNVMLRGNVPVITDPFV
ncbi:hypothetical protein E4H12_05745 [Candidatus Thorarchaeota archaeon]|nr:MAG: hypothetical protein E4H12_05745 [Candidatus Thorarchaeota archaeon]